LARVDQHNEGIPGEPRAAASTPNGFDPTKSRCPSTGMIYAAPDKVAANPENSGSRNRAESGYADRNDWYAAPFVAEVPPSAAEGGGA
jgi:hypothetical protein